MNGLTTRKKNYPRMLFREGQAKTPAPLALLSFSPSCCMGTRHVRENAHHVGEKGAMLMEMPAMLEILLPCRFSGRHVSWKAVMLNIVALKRKYPENLKRISGVYKIVKPVIVL